MNRVSTKTSRSSCRSRVAARGRLADRREAVPVHRPEHGLPEEASVELIRPEVLPAHVKRAGVEAGALDEPPQDDDRPLLLLLIGQPGDQGLDDAAPEGARQHPVEAVRLRRDEPVVADEDLVPALPGHADGDVAARLPAQEEQRHRRQIGHRLVEVPDGLLDHVGRDGGHPDLAVLGPVVARGLARVLPLAERGIVVAERERRERAGRRLPREGQDRRGVEPAGEEHALRDVRHHPRVHGVPERLADAAGQGAASSGASANRSSQ